MLNFAKKSSTDQKQNKQTKKHGSRGSTQDAYLGTGKKRYREIDGSVPFYHNITSHNNVLSSFFS